MSLTKAVSLTEARKQHLDELEAENIRLTELLERQMSLTKAASLTEARKQHLDELEAENIRMTELLKRKESEIKELKQTSKQTSGFREEAIATLTQEKEALEAGLKNIKTALATKITLLQGENADLSKKYLEMQKTNIGLLADGSRLQKELTIQTERASIVEDNFKRVETGAAELVDDLERLELDHDALQTTLKEVQSRVKQDLAEQKKDLQLYRAQAARMHDNFYKVVYKKLKSIEPYVAKLEEDKRKLEDSLKEVAQVNKELQVALRLKKDLHLQTIQHAVKQEMRVERAREAFSRGRALIKKTQKDEKVVEAEVAQVYTDIAPTSLKDLAMVSLEQLQALLPAPGVRKVLSREKVNEVIKSVQGTIAQLQQEIERLTDQNATLSQQVESLFRAGFTKIPDKSKEATRLERINNLRGVEATVDYKL